MIAKRWMVSLLGALALVGARGVDAPVVREVAPAATAQAAMPSVRTMLAARDNYTARSSRSIRYIVIHTIEGSEAGAISWFQNSRSNVSAHYVVSHAGRVTRCVPDMSVAWHAGNWTYNEQSIGIENEGYAYRNTWTETQYRVLADLVRALCDRYGIPKTRSRIIGHKEVPGATHTDPGPHFNWTKFMNLVTGGSGGAAPAPTPAPQPAPAPTTSGTVGLEVNADVLNVRADVWGTIIGQVRRGQRFVSTASRSGWYRIDFGNRTGWVSGDYVRRVAVTGERVTADVLNVRSGASTGSSIIGQTSTGNIHARLGQDGEWYLVQFDGRRGWVHGGYTSTVSAR